MKSRDDLYSLEWTVDHLRADLEAHGGLPSLVSKIITGGAWQTFYEGSSIEYSSGYEIEDKFHELIKTSEGYTYEQVLEFGRRYDSMFLSLFLVLGGEDGPLESAQSKIWSDISEAKQSLINDGSILVFSPVSDDMPTYLEYLSPDRVSNLVSVSKYMRFVFVCDLTTPKDGGGAVGGIPAPSPSRSSLMSRAKRGRSKGSSPYARTDAPLIVAGVEMLRDGTVPSVAEAAKAVGAKAKGGGTLASREKRIARKIAEALRGSEMGEE